VRRPPGRAPTSGRLTRTALALLAVVAACSLWRGPYTEHLPPLAQQGFEHPSGETLLAALACTSCHAADDATNARLHPLPAPDLSHVGARLAPAALADLLSSPQAVRPGTRMPDLLGSLPEAERQQAQRELLHYLVSLGGPMPLLPEPPDPWPVERGAELFERLGCLACHGNDLDGRALARRADRRALAAFLADPLAAWPSGRMPDLQLDAQEADALACYLLRDHIAAGPTRQIDSPGLRSDLYVFDGQLSVVPPLAGRTPTRTQIVPRVGLLGIDPQAQPEGVEPAADAGLVSEYYAVRQAGELFIATSGEHVLYTSSDDGSRLFVDGALVVDNDGLHGSGRKQASVTLDAGWHALEITFFENEGDAELEAGFVVDDEEQPFEEQELRTSLRLVPPQGWEELTPDPQAVARGRERYLELGCAACHAGAGSAPAPAAPPLTALHYLERGCLADEVPSGLPDYHLDPVQKQHLREALAGSPALAMPLPAERSVARRLEQLDCLACHERDARGGPVGRRRAAFTGAADLGDEGRLPPTLTGVGDKLRLAALRGVLLQGERVRPYMHTRMPAFGPAALDGLPEALAAADGATPPSTSVVREFDAVRVEAGRQLAGKDGLSCISCHTAAGQASLGLPGLDLTLMHARLQPAWFERWMSDPIAMRPGTRMPTFFEEGRSLGSDAFGGSAEAQIDALWDYLALGAAMPLPPGVEVDPAAYELVPVDRPLYIGCFMQGLSARVLAVGFPEKVHLAFDEEHVRLARLWKGRFFDAEGTWRGRAGRLEQPPGEAVRELPPGDAWAWLAGPDAPWPETVGRDSGWRMRGHTRDAAGLPTFAYAHGDGRLPLVEESPTARLSGDGAHLRRDFVLHLGPDDALPWHRAAVAAHIGARADAPGSFETDDGLTLSVAGATAEVRTAPDGRQELLVVPAAPDARGESRFSVELHW